MLTEMNVYPSKKQKKSIKTKVLALKISSHEMRNLED